MYDHHNPMSAMLVYAALRLNEQSEELAPPGASLLQRLFGCMTRLFQKPSKPDVVRPEPPVQMPLTMPEPAALRDAA